MIPLKSIKIGQIYRSSLAHIFKIIDIKRHLDNKIIITYKNLKTYRNISLDYSIDANIEMTLLDKDKEFEFVWEHDMEGVRLDEDTALKAAAQ